MRNLPIQLRYVVADGGMVGELSKKEHHRGVELFRARGGSSGRYETAMAGSCSKE